MIKVNVHIADLGHGDVRPIRRIVGWRAVVFAILGAAYWLPTPYYRIFEWRWTINLMMAIACTALATLLALLYRALGRDILVEHEDPTAGGNR